jgi:hypothetical protein
MQVKRVGFFSYNAITGITNGWHRGIHGRQAFVIGNQTDENLDNQGFFSDPASQWNISRQVTRTWPEFECQLSRLERVVLYLGTAGCQSVIVQALGYPPRCSMFLMSPQNISSKLFVLALADFLPDARRIDCEPGGQESMRRIIESFLERPVWTPCN